jgi:hypothetical protein
VSAWSRAAAAKDKSHAAQGVRGFAASVRFR